MDFGISFVQKSARSITGCVHRRQDHAYNLLHHFWVEEVMECRWNRRVVLQASGLSLALPGLESLEASTSRDSDVSDDQVKAKRFVSIGTYLGFYQDAFFPKQSGSNYEMSEFSKLNT